jgi:hypothetical protein
MNELEKRLESLGEHIKNKPKQPDSLKPAEVVQLPFWPEPARGVPNSALRGALFAAIQGKDRRYMKRELLAVQQGMQIRFTGMQLDQSDLDVWELALHLARLHPLGSRCEFTVHGFLKALGRSTGKPMHEWLKDVFARLAGAVVEITHNSKTYFGSLIEGGVRDENTGLYIVNLNPELVRLYGAGMWTGIDWEQRKALGRKPLAQWLHGFYASHAQPFPLKIETLHELSGSRNASLRDFRRRLKTALNELRAVGAIHSYEIDKGDLVHVARAPSDSQRRHLTHARPRKQ